MNATFLPSPSDRLVRSSALLAVLSLACALLCLGLYFYWPGLAAAAPADPTLLSNLSAETHSARSHP
jgi:hypothetical protein